MTNRQSNLNQMEKSLAKGIFLPKGSLPSGLASIQQHMDMVQGRVRGSAAKRSKGTAGALEVFSRSYDAGEQIDFQYKGIGFSIIPGETQSVYTSDEPGYSEPYQVESFTGPDTQEDNWHEQPITVKPPVQPTDFPGKLDILCASPQTSASETTSKPVPPATGPDATRPALDSVASTDFQTEEPETMPEAARAFEEDIQSLLEESRRRDRQQGTHAPEQQLAPASGSSQPEEPRSHPHSLFETMGKNMAYATSFDLGSVSLNQKFDEFDRQLDRESAPRSDAGSSFSFPDKSLSMTEIVEDLARIDMAKNKSPSGKTAQEVETPANSQVAEDVPTPDQPQPSTLYPDLLRGTARQEAMPQESSSPVRVLEPETPSPNRQDSAAPGLLRAIRAADDLPAPLAAAVTVAATVHELDPSAMRTGTGGWEFFSRAREAGTVREMLNLCGLSVAEHQSLDEEVLSQPFLWIGGEPNGQNVRVVTHRVPEDGYGVYDPVSGGTEVLPLSKVASIYDLDRSNQSVFIARVVNHST